MKKVKCETCFFWGGERTPDRRSHWGPCRIYAPAIGDTMQLPVNPPARNDGHDVKRGDWPYTAFNDWCGQFEVLLDRRDVGRPLPQHGSGGGDNVRLIRTTTKDREPVDDDPS